jgi:hypothetical protein
MLFNQKETLDAAFATMGKYGHCERSEAIYNFLSSSNSSRFLDGVRPPLAA